MKEPKLASNALWQSPQVPELDSFEIDGKNLCALLRFLCCPFLSKTHSSSSLGRRREVLRKVNALVVPSGLRESAWIYILHFSKKNTTVSKFGPDI